MKNYLVTYNMPSAAMASLSGATEEQKANGLKAWFAWKEKFNGQIQDFGAPVAPAQALTTKGEWSPSKNAITGYSLVSGQDEKAVRALFEDHPHLAYHPDASIEVSEFIQM